MVLTMIVRILECLSHPACVVLRVDFSPPEYGDGFEADPDILTGAAQVDNLEVLLASEM